MVKDLIVEVVVTAESDAIGQITYEETTENCHYIHPFVCVCLGGVIVSTVPVFHLRKFLFPALMWNQLQLASDSVKLWP